ncbi:GYF domain 2 [Candidatus Rhabdochlamydia oedothoracis]|uniref:GYF domain 2 n=1 Tax=Candidatus Rhabdochlamydia oedothoracis TaxID=2720720 RepID=A0ABX8V1R2_9BACT|nr:MULTISPECIES: DUF4339 domain-containing protein [Rhabdochlamydia]KAG6558796.1 hypothetical protein RHOW815_001207 [Candidatus Rhabdochlamydia sp. W815]MCL6756568.1 DUF4339 domain-containing protein [Candidatus Rhabdochlamydia oedothoracis]QYF48442.1 GYF domain 2 [Candidatus Rhabdochlamydia oedothoracis]
MTLLFYITISLFWGWITALFAQKKGLNPRNWYIAGILFCALAFIAVLFQRKKNLKIPNPVHKPELIPIDPPQRENLWYYLDEKGQQFGPISFQALTIAWKNKKIQGESYVWNEDLENWKKFKEVLKITTPKI